MEAIDVLAFAGKLGAVLFVILGVAILGGAALALLRSRIALRLHERDGRTRGPHR